MTLPTQHIIKHLFRVDTLEEVSRQQLEELVEEYPSFGVGRYLLSHKLQAEAADRFGEETQKTNLYFTNPFWLQWLLQGQASRPAVEWRPTSAWKEESERKEVPEWREESEWKESPAPVEEWNAAGEAELPAEEVFAPVTDTTEATIDTTIRHEEEPDEVGETPPAEPEPPAGPSAADLLLQSIAAIQDEREAQRKEPEVAAVQEVPPAQDVPSAKEEAEPPASIAGLALEQVELEEKAPEVETPTSPVFEPYHTVDYFASQGIRLVQEENPSDRLGKQLKSFTDWLKVMRRLPQKNKEIVPDIAAERQVQAIAAHSIEGREVVTEAMAEVLAKQGMREKATEMYRKLSLLEPEKSAYFATKIEQLKII